MDRIFRQENGHIRLEVFGKEMPNHEQSQSQKQSRSGKQISGESSLLGNAGNSNNGGQAGT